MDGRKRTVQIKFRVTEAERDLILEKMKLVPTRNMAAYLRKIAIDGYIIQIDHADIKAMTAEIQKIGVNVNQIARRVNATGNAYQEDIEEIKGVLAEIWRLQRLNARTAMMKWAYSPAYSFVPTAAASFTSSVTRTPPASRIVISAGATRSVPVTVRRTLSAPTC